MNVLVALPPAPQDPLIALPNQPAAPPTLADIVRAMKFLRDVTTSRGIRFSILINPILISSSPASEQRPMDQKSSDQDLAAAATYQHHILHEVLAAAAPLR
jgi:hypothetical protein